MRPPKYEQNWFGRIFNAPPTCTSTHHRPTFRARSTDPLHVGLLQTGCFECIQILVFRDSIRREKSLGGRGSEVWDGPETWVSSFWQTLPTRQVRRGFYRRSYYCQGGVCIGLESRSLLACMAAQPMSAFSPASTSDDLLWITEPFQQAALKPLW